MPGVLSVFRRPRRERRFQRGVYLLPGMFTVGNLFCGWASIVYAMRGDFATAAPLIGIAMILDTLDGRIARVTGAASDFGGEFDSLADVVSFGVAPAILMFSWGLESLGRLGWAAGFLYVTAAAIRLARFNIQAKGSDRRYFVGLPSPPAAGVLAATVYAFPGGLDSVTGALAALPVVLAPAGLMVSRIRYRSFSALIPGRRQPSLVLLVVAGVIAAIAVNPPVVLALMAYAYLASGLLGLAFSRVRRRPRADDARPPEAATQRDRTAS